MGVWILSTQTCWNGLKDLDERKKGRNILYGLNKYIDPKPNDISSKIIIQEQGFVVIFCTKLTKSNCNRWIFYILIDERELSSSCILETHN